LLDEQEASSLQGQIAALQRNAVAVDATPSAVLATLKGLAG